MALTKEQLKVLSDETFFDNDQGEIEPAEHRVFNEALIDFIDSGTVEVFTGSTPPTSGFKDGDIFIQT
jgi:hypothetical protein